MREMIDFRKKKESLKNEVNKLHDEVKAKNDTVLRVFYPSLDNVKNDLMMNINQQEEFNEKTQEEIQGGLPRTARARQRVQRSHPVPRRRLGPLPRLRRSTALV